ncbi:hypothetical protein GQ44DRAFT_715765 [Phaeosphaeriaceae sp. PMI808]|nr:hypothetical protein GQ44DRAFT_715765 [Phaeosphaeriaceae sp. PMI808]
MAAYIISLASTSGSIGVAGWWCVGETNVIMRRKVKIGYLSHGIVTMVVASYSFLTLSYSASNSCPRRECTSGDGDPSKGRANHEINHTLTLRRRCRLQQSSTNPHS